MHMRVDQSRYCCCPICVNDNIACPVDIRAGRAAGSQTVGVLCGFGQQSELVRAGADLILPTTAMIANVLLSPGS